MEVLIGLVIGILIAAVISGFIIWVVGKLNLGLKVDSFGWAMLAGLIIGVLNGLVGAIIGETSGIIGALISLVISAAVILLAGKMLKGMQVDGFAGALLAAVAIAVITFLLGMVLVSIAVT